MKIHALCHALIASILFGSQIAFSAPDLILFNGQVYTVDDTFSIVESVSIQDGKISAVGANDELLATAGPATKRIDLKGKTVIPGLIDAHGHLPGLGQSLQTLDFTGTTSYDAIVEMVAERARTLPPGQWILGRGWDQNDWPDTALPLHEPLSAATPDHPVYLVRIDGHAALANAKALALAGIDATSADPPGGRILRGESGTPTGVLIDTAQGLVSRHIPPATAAQSREAIALVLRECVKHGLTGVHDAGVSQETIAIYKELIDADAFPLRVYAMLRGGLPRAEAAPRPLIGYGENRLTVRCVKVVSDGALGSRGAALLEPYTDEPDNTGLMIVGEDRLRALTIECLNAGFQVAAHAIGDRANRETLNAYESALKTVGADRDVSNARLRIEHAQIVSLADIPRFAELDIIPSMQATHATSDMPWAPRRVGEDRLAGAYAWRKFLDQGCRIANGSDFPVENVNPLWGIYAAVTRQDHEGLPRDAWQADQCMTREEALCSFTIDAAYAAFEEPIKGSLEAGKLADLVVLSKDIMTVTPAEILDTQVLMTMVGGEMVYSADGVEW